jgi:hypothetical protein
VTENDSQNQVPQDRETAARAERRAFFQAESERESRQGLVVAQMLLGPTFTPEPTQAAPDMVETHREMRERIAQRRPPLRDEAQMLRLGQTGSSQ